MTNQKRLKALIEEYQLSRKELSDILEVSIDTVHAWLKPISNKSSRSISKDRLTLLVILLERLDLERPRFLVH